MNNRIDAIYARQSVDKKDSISIESQIEFCKYELKGGNCKEYTDKGYSGKNTDRPKFQELVRDIKRGLIAKVIVYKLDRISRSILDFANMMELFQQYDVEFVSSTEKFDTSTPMGRASGTGRAQAGTCEADSRADGGNHQPGTGQPDFRLPRHMGRCIL